MATNKRRLWPKLGRFISTFVVACFFLPFFGISCSGEEMVTISGTDMVGGCRPGGPIAAEREQRRSVDADFKGAEKVPREPMAIAAIGIALITFGLSWLRSRTAVLGAFVLSLACIGALVALYRDVSVELQSVVVELARADSRGMGQVDAGSRFGLWLTCLGLLAIAALTALELRERET